MFTSLFAIAILLWVISNQHQKERLNILYQQVSKILNDRGIAVPHTLIPETPMLTDTEELASENRQGVCSKIPSESVENKYRVYEWVDGKGTVQISDKFPTTNYSKLQIKDLHIEDFFQLDVESSQANLPAFTEDHIRAGVSKTYRTFRDVIKIAEIRKIKLSIKFISDKEQFHAYRKQVAPDTNYKATGFYSPHLNQSTIWAVGDKKHLTRIALHEASHAIVAAMFGDIPIWLNEGLAGYFEKMVITGEQNYTFATNDEHFVLLRRNQVPSLYTHFSQSHAEWNQAHKSDLNYAIDWSLIFYLMTQEKGRNLLRYMLDHHAVNYCRPFNAIEFINQNYPGGLKLLDSEWRRWVRESPSGIVTF
jgi:hypothetical protein